MMRERTYTPEQLPKIDKRYILGYMEGRAAGFAQEGQAKNERAGEAGV